jgi:hypothetical protein
MDIRASGKRNSLRAWNRRVARCLLGDAEESNVNLFIYPKSYSEERAAGYAARFFSAQNQAAGLCSGEECIRKLKYSQEEATHETGFDQEIVNKHLHGVRPKTGLDRFTLTKNCSTQASRPEEEVRYESMIFLLDEAD